MDENLQHRLGLVNVVSQQRLEEKIENDVEALTKEKLIGQEEARLQRVQNLIDKLNSRKIYLERKYRNATRISVRSNLKEQIARLENTELAEAKADFNDISHRLSDLKYSDNEHEDRKNIGKRPGESDKDYLIRTGQITAFGSAAGFRLETENDDNNNIDNNNTNDDFNIGQASQQMQINISDDEEAVTVKEESDDSNQVRIPKVKMQDEQISDSDSEYMEEDNSYNEDGEGSSEVLEDSDEDIGIFEDEDRKSIKKQTKDDGDERVYQRRLNNWIKHRSSKRITDKLPNLPEWRKPHPNIPDAKLNDIFKIPGEVYSLLFNYQKTCVQWLYELFQQQNGGIIGDEMGLGKTIQVIAFLAGLHHSGLLDGPVLIVCPATVMKQWCNELHHWWPPLRTVILHSIGTGLVGRKKLNEDQLEELLINSNPEEFSYEDLQKSSKIKSGIESNMNLISLIDKVVREGHIIITTYVGLRIHSDKLLKVKWAYAVLDEGHNIRNPDSDISLTCKKLKTRNRIILSGTPIQNNLNELWSLFDFILPGKLGTLPVFQQQFVMPINMGGYANASNIQVQTGYKCAVALRDLISPYLLRRVKSDVAKDLPQKKEMVLFCKLTQYQRNKYLEFLNSKELNQIKNGKRHVLYGIDILRKICNHPDILKKDLLKDDQNYGDPRRSGKMQVVKQLLLLWKKEGHKTLLFTQSRQMLDILEDFVSVKDPDLLGIKYLRMDGTTNIGKRQDLVDEFNLKDYDLFLLTTRVGGLGVNLTGANRIIIFDPDWNPSTDMQARERAWRIGQKREVSIYRLMVSGTIEEKIYHRQIFKQFLMNKILSDPRQKRFFKMNELHDLFSLGGDDGLASNEMTMEVEKSTKNLMESRTQQSDDFVQVANITGVSKLESFYNGKEQNEKKKTDDDRLIEGLLGGSGGLATAATHDQMVKSHLNTGSSDKLISREAERIAEDALIELRKSRKSTKKFNIGTPTWTGKFGKAGKVIKKSGKINSKKIGSAQILARIREARDDITSEVMEEENSNKALIEKIEIYLENQPNYFATSSNIIQYIGLKLTEKKDIVRVRAMLRKIAVFDKKEKGWFLNKEFRS